MARMDEKYLYLCVCESAFAIEDHQTVWKSGQHTDK